MLGDGRTNPMCASRALGDLVEAADRVARPTGSATSGVANPTPFRLLNDPDRVPHSPAALSGRRVLESRVHRVAETGRLRVSEQRAVGIIHAAGTGVVQTLLSTPVEQRDDGLAEDVYEAVLRQVLTDAPGPPGAELMARTVAFRAVAPRLDVLSAAGHHRLIEWLDRAVDALTRDPR